MSRPHLFVNWLLSPGERRLQEGVHKRSRFVILDKVVPRPSLLLGRSFLVSVQRNSCYFCRKISGFSYYTHWRNPSFPRGEHGPYRDLQNRCYRLSNECSQSTPTNTRVECFLFTFKFLHFIVSMFFGSTLSLNFLIYWRLGVRRVS